MHLDRQGRVLMESYFLFIITSDISILDGNWIILNTKSEMTFGLSPSLTGDHVILLIIVSLPLGQTFDSVSIQPG